MRNARAEAAERVGGRYDVRVLEPSPPPVDEPPWYADDPVAGGEVVPVERPGVMSWTTLCVGEDDQHLRDWCADRWLVRAPLQSLPRGFAATRASLHRVAEHVLAPCRHRAVGKIGLRFTYHGFGTPFFGDGRQLRVEDGELRDGEHCHELTTLEAAAGWVGIAPGAKTGVYEPTTPGDLESLLVVHPRAARALGDWFGFGTSLLEQLRAEATDEDAPSRVQLWPEHFDVALDLGPDNARANYGASPGDAEHPEPYLYVGPWQQRTGEFWNEPFGASLGYAAILAGADPLEFLRKGKSLLSTA